ncbi:DUF1295 domain-containing protein [Puteibacter caeruleilacunae]|nr:DUF1295 domain-containing protein [Puteibacter caeruleilacunae]
MTIFLQAALLIWILVTLLWIWSVIIKNVSIIDLFWGMSFVVVNSFYVLTTGELTIRKILIMAFVGLWGLRLSIHLALRNIGKGEDFRYQQFRKDYGEKRYWWFSYMQTFLLQGILVMLVSLPLLGINLSQHTKELNILDYIGIALWLLGFSFETIGDYQLSRFKKNPNNKGKVLDTGLWKYTRHPNYFGDAAVWWSFALFSIAASAYWYIIGAIIMTYLLVKISGVSLLEKSLNKTKPQYQEYIRKTSAFIPWFPKK